MRKPTKTNGRPRDPRFRPVRQQPSMRPLIDNTEPRLAFIEAREWLELSIGISGWSVGS